MKSLIRNIPITFIGIPGLWLFATAAGRPTLDKEKSQIEFVGSKAGSLQNRHDRHGLSRKR